jgi:uncharacterized membrane protein (UPF0127 family)
MKRCFFLFLFLPLALFASKTLQLEIAKTDEEKNFGLMNRRHLEENQGMLFIYDNESILSFWMFNTLIDLSIAFINCDNKIVDIRDMKSFGEIMDKKRPVNNINDLNQYPPDDPIINFFSMTAIKSKRPARMAIETNIGWFDRNQIKIGDKVIINGNKAVFTR